MALQDPQPRSTKTTCFNQCHHPGFCSCVEDGCRWIGKRTKKWTGCQTATQAGTAAHVAGKDRKASTPRLHFPMLRRTVNKEWHRRHQIPGWRGGRHSKGAKITGEQDGKWMKHVQKGISPVILMKFSNTTLMHTILMLET
jgi:hypothetical protein